MCGKCLSRGTRSPVRRMCTCGRQPAHGCVDLQLNVTVLVVCAKRFSRSVFLVIVAPDS